MTPPPILIQHPTGLLIRRRFQRAGLDGTHAAEVIQGDVYRLAELQNVATVVDLGAHIGAFTFAAQARFPEAEIAAVEMDIRNVLVLLHNAELSADIRCCKPALVVHAACYYGATHVPFLRAVQPRSDNTGDGTIVPPWMAVREGTPTQWVRTVTLEQLFHDREIDLLKLDVEDAERNILAHADLSRVRVIVGEYHDQRLWFEFIGRRFHHNQWSYDVLDPGPPNGVFRLIRHADRDRYIVPDLGQPVVSRA